MLQVNELNQYYGGSHILRGVSFEAITGEVTCLLSSGRVRRSPTANRTSGYSLAWRMSRRDARFFRA